MWRIFLSLGVRMLLPEEPITVPIRERVGARTGPFGGHKLSREGAGVRLITHTSQIPAGWATMDS